MAIPRFLLRVLLVTDGDEEGARARTVLQRVGITFIQTAALDAAVFAATEMKPGLLLIDSDDGNAALALIRKIRRSRDHSVARTPAILFTGSTDRRFIATARDSGIDALLLKPVISTMLRQRIDRVTSDARRFVNGRSYVGPCRRRRVDSAYRGPQRRGGNRAFVLV
jgi:DNA-binding response OmpR family regulator